MSYEIDSFLARQVTGCKPALPAERVLSGKMSLNEWKCKLRDGLSRCLGEFPDNPPQLNLTKLETRRFEGYMRTFLTYESQEGLTVPAYYLAPDAPLLGNPAVVAICGHGFGVNDIVGINIEGRMYGPNEDKGYHKAFAVELCKKGFYVIAPEMFGFGFLRTQKDKETHTNAKSCYKASTHLLMCGSTTANVRVCQCMRAMDVLERLGDADTSRTGLMGISGGGLVTAFTAAMTDRVKACVVSGYSSMFKTSILAVDDHCIDNFFFDILNLCELSDVLSLIAPRPMLWEVADRDEYFPVESVREAAREVKKMYAHLGANERFAVDEFSGMHEISGAMAYDFLARYL